MEEEKKIQEEIKSDTIETNSNVDNVTKEQFEQLQKQYEDLHDRLNKHSLFIEEYYKSIEEEVSNTDTEYIKW